MVQSIRKTILIHPSVDKIIRLIQMRFVKNGLDYDYSAALNALVVGAMLLGLDKGNPDPKIVRSVRDFVAKRDTNEIPNETLMQYEEYARKMDRLLAGSTIEKQRT